MKHFIRKGLIVAALGLMVLPVSASAHFWGSSSVDSGEIRWGTFHGTTQWTTLRDTSISTWNGLNPIEILGDTSFTIEDLSFKDVNRSDVVWSGQFTQFGGADLIEINNYFMNNYATANRQNTITHEIGHALGLDHSITGNVMYYANTSQTSLGTHDIEDYHTLWGY